VKKEKALLDRVLARGALGGPHYDEILERVLERTETPEGRRAGRRRVWLLVPAGALASAVAAWLLLARPAGQPFTAKGSGESHAIGMGCVSADGTCRPGAKVVFTVNTAVASGYVGAYAERADGKAGQRIWYFPTTSGASPHVAPGTGTEVVPEGIEIGAEQPPGRYRVTAWLSARPLTRSEVEANGVDSMATREAIDLVVQP
jgi:hypothetical protein